MRPNILFLFPDQHRGDWLPFRKGEQGEDNPLPLRMDSLRGLMDRGTTFTQAVTNSPLCAPARACLALGRPYEQCGVWNNNYCCPLDRPSFYRVLRDGGYQVGGVGKFDLHKPLMYWGEEGWLPQLGRLGFSEAVDHEGKWDSFWASETPPRGPYGQFLHSSGLLETYWRDYVRRYYDPMDTMPTELPQEAYADDWETEKALCMLQRFSEKEAPWFLMVNFSGPHDPWDITRQMKAEWEKTDFPIPSGQEANAGRIREVRRNYAAMLCNIDRNIGRLLDFLTRTGQMENTIVIYASDHGEMLGDRGRFYKSVPFEPSIHIPLIISGGDALPGRHCGELVQLSDLAATITDIAGLSMPAGDTYSLLPLASGENPAPVRAYQYSALYVSPKQTADSFAGYENLRGYGKDMAGPENIDSFNRRLGLPLRGTPEHKKEKKRDWRCVRTKKYKLIEYLSPVEHVLYDLETDSREQVNLAEARQDIVAELKEMLPPRPEK